MTDENTEPNATPEPADVGDEAPTETPAAAEGEGAEGRPREVIRGIHPELLCQCNECAPEYTELQWFSVDEKNKVKGSAMLFCQRSSRKYFSPAPELQAWLAERPAPRGRK